MKRQSLGEQTKETNERHPVLLKTGGPTRWCAVLIGALELELWQHPPPSEDQYVRLVVSPHCTHGPKGRRAQGSRDGPVDAILEPAEASLLSGALDEWRKSLRTQSWSSEDPVLTASVASVSLTLWGVSRCATPKAEISLTAKDGSQAGVTLTPLEGTLLAGAIGGIFDDDDPQD